jgi:ABC-type transporter Mla subunit MlaD
MAERALRLRLGLFLGASLVALAGLVVLFGGAPRLFSTDVKYTILFPEAPGIGPGIPIRKSGVRIGQVTALELDSETGQVRVRIAVDRKYLPRKSEDANITRGLLSGDTAIDFLPKLNAEGQPVPRDEDWPPGSDIPGVPPITPRSILNPASAALANAQQSLDRITKTFERFEQVAPRIERAADEATELMKEVRAFIPELRRTNQKLQNLIGADLPAPAPGGVVPIGFMAQPEPAAGEPNVRALIREAQETVRTIRPALEDLRGTVRRLEPELLAAVRSARQTFDGVNEVLSPDNRKEVADLLKNLNTVAGTVIKFALTLSNVLETADKTVKNVDAQVSQAGLVLGDVRAVTKPLALRAENLVKSVSDSADDLSKLVKEIRLVVGAFAREDGTFQKLLTDPTVYRNLDDAAGSLARIMARAEKITRDLEVFADKVARRPELIGVGGAIRPSSGLKELPGVPSYRTDWPPSSSARPLTGPVWLPPPQDGPPPPIQGFKP